MTTTLLLLALHLSGAAHAGDLPGARPHPPHVDAVGPHQRSRGAAVLEETSPQIHAGLRFERRLAGANEPELEWLHVRTRVNRDIGAGATAVVGAAWLTGLAFCIGSDLQGTEFFGMSSTGAYGAFVTPFAAPLLTSSILGWTTGRRRHRLAGEAWRASKRRSSRVPAADLQPGG